MQPVTGCAMTSLRLLSHAFTRPCARPAACAWPAACTWRSAGGARLRARNSVVKQRVGRALVELLVSTLLLAVASSAALSLLHVTSAATARITQLGVARDITRELAEHAAANACANRAGTSQRERVRAVWNEQVAAGARTLQVDLELFAHPMSAGAPRSLSAVVAGWCA